MTGKQAWAAVATVAVATALVGSGCRSTEREPGASAPEQSRREARVVVPEAPPQPAPTVKFSTFQAVGLKALNIAPLYAGHPANQKAAARIEKALEAELRSTFPELKFGADAENVKSGPGEALLIDPVLSEIKFIGGGARFWVGAMAGNSNARLRVTFRNAKTGAVVATPEFYRVGNAMAGAWSVGASDNVMLDNLARDVAAYVRQNL